LEAMRTQGRFSFFGCVQLKRVGRRMTQGVAKLSMYPSKAVDIDIVAKRLSKALEYRPIPSKWTC
ncbi:MAG: hypothetical protein ACREA2_11025, partial [Blastocatellia bacterium]